MIAITTIDLIPELCYECPCHDGENGQCNADKEKRYSFEYRPYWCPLKNVNLNIITKKEMAGMSFSDAILAMKQGMKVRLPWWGGYWYIADGTLRIHCINDNDFNVFSEENTEPLDVLSFMTANCWEIVPRLN